MVERARDRVRRGVVVHDRRGSGEQRVGAADHAESHTASSSSARSSRHQTRCRICTKFAGGSSRYGMPRASAEYRWWCAHTLPGITRQPEQSIRSAPARRRRRPRRRGRRARGRRRSITATGSSEVTTVPPASRSVTAPPLARAAGFGTAATRRGRVPHGQPGPPRAVERVERAGHGARPSARGRSRPRPSRRTGPRAGAPRRGCTRPRACAAAGTMPSDFSVVVTGCRLRRRTPRSARSPSPMWTAPSIWPSSSVGLIALPTSCAATIFSIRPSSSRITTCVAQPYAKCVTGSSRSGARLARPVDRDLAVELRPARSSRLRPAVQRGLELRRRLLHGSAAQHGRARGRRLPGVQLAHRVDDHADASAVETELLARDLAERRCARPGPSRSTNGTASRCRRPPAAGSRCPSRAGRCRCPCSSRRTRSPRTARSGTRSRTASRHALSPTPGPSTCPVPNRSPTSSALRHRISQPSIPTRSARMSSMPSIAKFDLVRAESAHRAARRVVRVDGARLDVDVREPVRAARVAGTRARAPCRRRSRTRRCPRRSGRARPPGGPRRRSRPCTPS